MQANNLHILITGGASGIAYETARYFIEKKNHVIIFDKNPETHTIAKSIGATAFQVDLLSETAVADAFGQISAPIRVCINCAGIAPAKKILSKKGLMPLLEFEKTIAVNLTASFNIMRHAVAHMAKLPCLDEKDKERGLILHTASIAAYEGQIGQTAYAASKAGIIGMTLPAARELAAYGIRVNTIAPGLVNTPLLTGMPENVQESLAAQVPFPKRFASAREYAKLAEHLIENTMLNGTVIRLDGALRMAPQ